MNVRKEKKREGRRRKGREGGDKEKEERKKEGGGGGGKGERGSVRTRASRIFSTELTRYSHVGGRG